MHFICSRKFRFLSDPKRFQVTQNKDFATFMKKMNYLLWVEITVNERDKMSSTIPQKLFIRGKAQS